MACALVDRGQRKTAQMGRVEREQREREREGGGGGKICHGSKSFAVCHERTVLCMSLPNYLHFAIFGMQSMRFKFSDQNRHSFMLDRWNWRSISLI